MTSRRPARGGNLDPVLARLLDDLTNDNLVVRLQGLRAHVVTVDDPLQREAIRETLLARLKALDVSAPGKLADAVMNGGGPMLKAGAEQPPRDDDQAGRYEMTAAGFVWHKTVKGGTVPVRLTNFSARITADVVEDDGIEERRVFEIEASLNGRPTPRFRVTPAEFGRMDWPPERLGAGAIVSAGLGAKDHARVAIQKHSGEEIPERRVYMHTGWSRLDDGQWAYLHAGGAIGGRGPVDGVDVVLDYALRNFVFQAVGDADEQRAAVTASLGVLDAAPKRITVPVYGAIFRAVLGDPDHGGHLAGGTGVYKTELAALAQQHFGAAMDSRHLPTTWASTANSIEGLAFIAKDALVTVDDFAPGGTLVDVQRLHASAARLFRAAGNRAGRNRMRADATLTAPRPPRGLVLSTGEDVPRGQSVLARMFVVEIGEGDVDRDALSRCQTDAAAGLYTLALAGFIRWLAPQLDDARRELRAAIDAARRAAAPARGMHARTVDIRAGLLFGLVLYVRFATEIGAITAAQALEIGDGAARALDEAAAEQAAYQTSSDPVTYYFELIGAAIASGRAHIADANGDAPENPARWGWNARTVRVGFDDERVEWERRGDCVGWVEGDDLYLEPVASHAMAQRVASNLGEAFPIGRKALAKRLSERGLLLSSERERRTLTVRVSLAGARRAVLHFASSTLAEPRYASRYHENSPLVVPGSLGNPPNLPNLPQGGGPEVGPAGRIGQAGQVIQTRAVYVGEFLCPMCDGIDSWLPRGGGPARCRACHPPAPGAEEQP